LNKDEGYLLIPLIQRRESDSFALWDLRSGIPVRGKLFLASPLFLKKSHSRFTNNEYAQVLYGIAYKDELFILPIK